jgi:hypothetical protein
MLVMQALLYHYSQSQEIDGVSAELSGIYSVAASFLAFNFLSDGALCLPICHSPWISCAF